ncbi:MAG: secretin N-terminal domain-containing protein, partial [bacterium]
MRSKIRILALLFVALSVFGLDGRAAETGALTKISFTSQGDKLVVAFKGTQRLRYRVKDFDSPPHLLVQFFGVRNGLPYSNLKIGKGGVSDIAVQEVDLNGQKITSVSIHMDRKLDYDFDLSQDGATFQLAMAQTSGGTTQGDSEFAGNVYSAGPETKAEAPVIHVPGEKKGTTQIPYSARAKETVFAQRAKGADTSPWISGPVILQDADISQTVRLLSEAAGGANIVVEASLVQKQSTTSANKGGQGGGTGASAAGITVTLYHISLEDALDIISSANSWTWRKFGDYYAIMSKSTANAGVNTVTSATIFEDTATRTDVVIMQPKNTYACVLASKISTVIPDVSCDPSTNYLMMRGVQRDLDRAREMINALDVPTQQITKLATQVTKIIRLKYIDLSNTAF